MPLIGSFDLIRGSLCSRHFNRVMHYHNIDIMYKKLKEFQKKLLTLYKTCVMLKSV